MGQCPVIGMSQIVQAIARGTNLKPKFQTSPKHVEARLKALTHIVQKFKVGTKEVPLPPVMEYAI